jgi:hypothetical protein
VRALLAACVLCLPFQVQAQSVTSIEPSAPVLPSNTLRFYITFDRPARGLVHQSGVKLLGSNNIPVEHAFMDFGQELWSPDGKRLTVLFDPGEIKRGVEAPNAELSPLKENENYKIIFGTFQHAFGVGPAIRDKINPASWTFQTVEAPARTVDITFDRVMDAALLADQLKVQDGKGRPVTVGVRVMGGGLGVRLTPSRPFKKGEYRISISPILEDVAGNRINEALDHPVNEKSGESPGLVIDFVVRGGRPRRGPPPA